MKFIYLEFVTSCQLAIIFDDGGSKSFISEGLDELENILYVLEDYQSLNLTIIRTSWSKNDGKAILKSYISWFSYDYI